jgi:hypothetical protein
MRVRSRCGRHLSVGTEAPATPSFDAPLVEIGFRRQHRPSCRLFAQMLGLNAEPLFDPDFAKRLYPGNYELLRAFRLGLAC